MSNKLEVEVIKGSGSLLKWVLLLGALFAAGALIYNIVLAPLWLANKAVSTAKGVTELATNPAVVKRQYELFHGRYNGIQALIQQIDTMKAGSGVDKEDQKLLNTEVRGLVAMCLKEVAAYNAESNQLTTGWLLGTSLPKQLDAAICRKEQA